MDLSQDFCDLLAAFDQAGARYLLIGGYAVSAHSKPRYTKDIDIWIDSDPANLERVGAALQAFGAPEQAIHDVRTCADTEIVWFLRGEVRRSDCGLLRNATSATLGSWVVRLRNESCAMTPGPCCARCRPATPSS
jgi:hypothetical protein